MDGLHFERHDSSLCYLEMHVLNYEAILTKVSYHWKLQRTIEGMQDQHRFQPTDQDSETRKAK